MLENHTPNAIYDETAARLEAAFLGFRRSYEVMYPAPVLQTTHDRVFGIKHVGLLAALVGSIVVSASHTIPVFLGIDNIQQVRISIELLIALAAFVMIEVGIVTFAYSATESAANRDDLHRVRAFTNAGKWFIALIMLIANVFYVLDANVLTGVTSGLWAGVRVVIYLAIGASAPVIAFITGDILAIDVLKHRSRQTAARERYEAAMNEYNAQIVDAWNRAKGKWGANVDIQVSKPAAVHSLNTGMNEQPSHSFTVHSVNTGVNERNSANVTGYSKQMSARDYLKQWFTDNPEYIHSTDSVDVLHQLFTNQTGVKVGRTSVHNVRKELQK